MFAAVLILSMLPTLIVPNSRAPKGAQFGSYEAWLRSQLRVPADSVVERAIGLAAESGADSFDDFIAAFLDAYAEAVPGEPISQVFTDRDLSDDALITFLQRRYSQIVDEGVLPRVYLTSFVQNSAVGGQSGPPNALFDVEKSPLSSVDGLLFALVERTISIPFRTLSSARPLGP